jgi:hypothetical protein
VVGLAAELHKLPDLLVYGHLLHQRIDASFGRIVDQPLRNRRRTATKQDKKYREHVSNSNHSILQILISQE